MRRAAEIALSRQLPSLIEWFQNVRFARSVVAVLRYLSENDVNNAELGNIIVLAAKSVRLLWEHPADLAPHDAAQQACEAVTLAARICVRRGDSRMKRTAAEIVGWLLGGASANASVERPFQQLPSLDPDLITIAPATAADAAVPASVSDAPGVVIAAAEDFAPVVAAAAAAEPTTALVASQRDKRRFWSDEAVSCAIQFIKQHECTPYLVLLIWQNFSTEWLSSEKRLLLAKQFDSEVPQRIRLLLLPLLQEVRCNSVIF